ncbi:CPBP family intramembrane glutamic endopeptidase [Flagellimonas allohymeniacidonis]|uniref:CPBP family intramembrane metalloprotease n=1 Tax=Flagellimonas allohymeniacidonis TaxID=2517819 RepID=A0A4Q8QE10_9FLAO|nr:type II CAAX endopeptidase family protein [Allomuricauda hymeniacidonis]TAI48651.1 CPBP family intramembrane metalloprotease [Allomuricauda hymeniacidonis]
MYIEQGYKGSLGLWKYLFLPIGFIAFMAFNYLATINSPVSVEDTLNQLIDQLGSNIVLIILLAPLAAGLFVVLGWTYLVHQQSITSLTTSRKRIDWKRIFFAFFLWGGLTVLLTGIDIYFSPEDYVWNFDLQKFIPLAIIAIILIPLQTSFEEYMFRGHIMQGLGIFAKNRWVPLFVTSILFGLMHIANPEVEKLGLGIMVFYIGTGFFLGILTLMDEGLELALGFHAANNLITALLVTADWTAFQTHSVYKDIAEPVIGWDILIPIFVVFPLLLVLFSRKYGWKNWKEKLFGRVMSEEEFNAINESESKLV